ncbi:MAG: hypothetical protein MUF77_07630 [Leptospira sp.]|nr:hypothetical protein [Leptospira sp.]
MKNAILILSFFLSVFVFDFLVFRKFQYVLPNESPWNTNHFFNFLYEYKRIQSLPKIKKRIIVLGSSIAYFSIQAKDLELELKKTYKLDVEVFFLAYAGNSPLYVYLLLDWLFPLEPDLVIYPINFIDYRLHRTYVLFPEGKNESVSEDILIQDALSFGEAPQSLWVFPWETWREVGVKMDANTQARYLLSGLFSFYQTKDIFFQNLTNLYQHRFGRNTSYHLYMGYPIPEGVSGMGWTGKFFSFPITKKIRQSGFWIEVTPFLLKEAPTNLVLRQGNITQTIPLTKSGWMKVELDPNFSMDSLVQAELGRTWLAYEASGAYLDYHRDPMGVRLEQTFALDRPPAGEQYIRRRVTEDNRYNGMSDEDYRRYFQYRLLDGLEFRPGIGYLVALKDAKLRIGNENFVPKFHFRYLQKIADRFREKQISFLLINNPENPVSLEWYERSNWYRDHLIFLKSLAGGTVHFVDLHSVLPMQGFSDFHHFTYPGMEQMNPIYAKEIGNLFPK